MSIENIIKNWKEYIEKHYSKQPTKRKHKKTIIRCAICNIKILKKNSRHKYCTKCSNLRRKIYVKKYNDNNKKKEEK